MNQRTWNRVDRLEYLIRRALDGPETCLKVFVSGVCSHKSNAVDRMHVCEAPRFHARDHHICICGKRWTDAQLTDSQYAVAAYTKAVE